MDISVLNNITFIGNSKGTTTFDYRNNKRGRFIFTYSNHIEKSQTIKFENIKFINFDPLNAGDTEMIILQSNTDNFYFIVNNCHIQNNAYRFLRVDYKCNKPSHNNTSILINNSNFSKNTEGIIKIYHRFDYGGSSLAKCVPIEINKTKFINNTGLFMLHYSNLIFNDCYFSQIGKAVYDKNPIFFIYSNNYNEYVTINNTIFSDIIIKETEPLINVKNVNLKIYNSKLQRCHSNFGYLIHIKNTGDISDDQFITIKNTTFSYSSSIFHGDKIKYEIYDSIFENFIMKISLPLLSDSKYSYFYIENTIFRDLRLTNGLFGEESQYDLKNIELNNIQINSRSLLYFLYNNISINSLTAENIRCLGDGDTGSFILFNSGETNRTMVINNLNVKKSFSNGSFIKIIGNSNQVEITDSSIDRIRSFGPIIKNDSKNKNTL